MPAIELDPAIAMIGSPTALGGHFLGMDKGPTALRSVGLLDRIRGRKALAHVSISDNGDAPIKAGWAADDDLFMKNRQRIIEYMPHLVVHAHRALGGAQATREAPNGPAPRLLVIGGDCTSHAGAMAGLKRRYPDSRLAIAWFDAHGDFNIPTTTPSGNVWGMPFAMLCGRGDPGLVASVSGPTVKEEDAALLGAQVLDEQESRMLAASSVATFGAGMLAGPAGLAALETWARVVGDRTDGMYIAFDLDALDESEGISVAMPEPKGLSLWTATVALRLLAATNRIVGFGPTATMPRSGMDMNRHADIVAQLTESALGGGA
ncbi:MAG TPA: arginase family protein [Candidatus Limnocylindria bacterium]|nr:arginase family protein [Candidatus Limnocylindria bacterium]